VSTKPFIASADISKLPLKDASISLCIFCLSLMGTNYLNFIREAWRVLKEEGELIISEVESRSPNWKKFM
jgi:ubiquinone/menaquinone biosynthesis C-methylase UbiE